MFFMSCHWFDRSASGRDRCSVIVSFGQRRTQPFGKPRTFARDWRRRNKTTEAAKTAAATKKCMSSTLDRSFRSKRLRISKSDWKSYANELFIAYFKEAIQVCCWGKQSNKKWVASFIWTMKVKRSAKDVNVNCTLSYFCVWQSKKRRILKTHFEIK